MLEFFRSIPHRFSLRKDSPEKLQRRVEEIDRLNEIAGMGLEWYIKRFGVKIEGKFTREDYVRMGAAIRKLESVISRQKKYRGNTIDAVTGFLAVRAKGMAEGSTISSDVVLDMPLAALAVILREEQGK